MVDPSELPAELRDRVEVLGVLGRGSFGVVLEVRVAGSPEPLALKVLSPEVDMARVRRELDACGRVRHPHVLRVHGYGQDDRRGWMLMERADGTLTAWLEGRDPPQVARAWEACRQVAAGLAALHVEGIVHRDLKPENVLLVRGEAKVGDLGLAKGGGLQTLTATGLVMGTPIFMSPEQIRGERLTPASDVFALGILLFRVATGRLPYASDAVRDLLPVITRGGPVAAGVPLGGCPEVVRACLDPDPARRPSAAALARDLGPPPRPEVPLTPDPQRATRVLTSPGLVRPGDPAVTPVKGVAARNVAMAGGRNVLGVVVVAALVVAVLRVVHPVGAPPQAPPPPAASSAGEPAWPEALGADFPAAVAHELARAQETFVDAAGGIHGLDAVADGVPAGWEPLLHADPGRWHHVVAHSPALGRWYAWVAAGGPTWELTASQQAALADLDRRFEAERQTPPFRPWLGLGPAPGPPQRFTLRSPEGVVVFQGSASGWTGTALRRIEVARAARRDLEEQVRAYFQGRASRFPGAELERHGLRSLWGLDDKRVERFFQEIHIFADYPDWRVELGPWLEPLTREVMAALAATRQALRREPRAARDVPYALNEVFPDLRGALISGYWSLGFEVVAGPPTEDVLTDVLRAVLWDHHGRAHVDLDRGRPEDFYPGRAALWARPFSNPAIAEVEDAAWFPWLLRYSFFHGALGRRPYAEMAARRARYEDRVEALSPRARADVEGALALRALGGGVPPAEVRAVLARYRALDPEALAACPDEFRDLTPRLEEIAHADP